MPLGVVGSCSRDGNNDLGPASIHYCIRFLETWSCLVICAKWPAGPMHDYCTLWQTQAISSSEKWWKKPHPEQSNKWVMGRVGTYTPRMLVSSSVLVPSSVQKKIEGKEEPGKIYHVRTYLQPFQFDVLFHELDYQVMLEILIFTRTSRKPQTTNLAHSPASPQR